MKSKCKAVFNEGLEKKNIGLVVDCSYRARYSSLDELKKHVSTIFEEVIGGKDLKYMVFFRDNEAIDDDYILYRYRIVIEGSDRYIGVRVVTFHNIVERIILVFDKELKDLARRVSRGEEVLEYNNVIRGRGTPPGQRYIPNFIIYRILGQPSVELDKWYLETDGLVRNRLKLSYEELVSLGMVTVERDFHCVTGWSVRGVKWRGVPVKRIIELTDPMEGVKWVYAVGLDGYSSIIPYRDILVDDALIVLEINDNKLSLEQGFPARLFIPHLYGWKGVKWLHKLVFLDRYRDGYWETLGYHPRGNIWLNERFKT